MRPAQKDAATIGARGCALKRNPMFFNETLCAFATSSQKNYLSSMKALNFSSFNFRFKNSENSLAIFDEIRRKFVVLTPEEWVRQHVIQHFLLEKNYPKSLINVEKTLKVNGLTKRYDLVVFNSNGTIFLLVECKAPDVKISQNTFDQIARYNLSLKAEHLMVTNGLNHYFCRMDFEQERYVFLEHLPAQATI